MQAALLYSPNMNQLDNVVDRIRNARTNIACYVCAVVLVTVFAGCVSTYERVVTRAETTPWQRWESLTFGTSNLRAELDFLVARTAALGFELRWEALPHQYRGRSNDALHVVILDAALGVDDAAYTLAHELAHLLQPPRLTEPESETFAELTAYGVMRGFGYDTTVFTARYLAYWKSGLPAARTYRVDVDVAVRTILDGWPLHREPPR